MMGRSFSVKSLLEQNAVESAKYGTPNLTKAVFAVELLGGDLAYGGIESEHIIAKYPGALLQRRQDGAAKAAALKVGVDAHSPDLGARVEHPPQGAHRHNLAVALADQEGAVVLEVRGRNISDISIPRTAAGVHRELLQAYNVKLPDDLTVHRAVVPNHQIGARSHRNPPDASSSE